MYVCITVVEVSYNIPSLYVCLNMRATSVGVGANAKDLVSSDFICFGFVRRDWSGI